MVASSRESRAVNSDIKSFSQTGIHFYRSFNLAAFIFPSLHPTLNRQNDDSSEFVSVLFTSFLSFPSSYCPRSVSAAAPYVQGCYLANWAVYNPPPHKARFLHTKKFNFMEANHTIEKENSF